jgi:RHS repeat-associated protein
MNQRRIRYDSAGNQTYDSYTGQGARIYDAENRLKQAQGSPNNQWQTYTYDADGHRIKRNVNGIETWQLYGMDGELLAEYASGAAPYLPATEYGYRGGELLTTISSGDTQRLTRFVTNLYYGAKQRDPNSQELQDGINQLAAAGAQSQAQLQTVAAQIARSLFTSTNYETAAPARSDLQYVADLYYAYLQRGPDDGGLGFWAGQAAGSRANVCNAFEASGEFQTLVATLYGTAASDNERTEHFVNDFYLGAYGRGATATELQQQRDALNTAAAQGLSQVQAQAENFGRSLFAAQVNDANLSNTQYVTNLYEAFLQRGPDAGGLGWWSGQAGVGSGRQNVLNAFATCGAFRELAGTLYREANWLVADQLGTPRMIANKSGSLASMKRHDYLPFGEELFAGTGGRTSTQGYGSDSVRQKFTQKERDIETGLDYSIHRYYTSTQGRFTSPDPYVIFFEMKRGTDAEEQEGMLLEYISQPQNWSRYSYGLNNPLNHTDPTGMRPPNKFEQAALGRLNQLAEQAEKDGNTDLANGLREASRVISGIIEALGKGKFDVGVNVAVNAILNIGNSDYANSGTVSIRTRRGTVIVGEGQNKCNIFVASTHARGAGLGFRRNGGRGRGYPLVGERAPAANWLGDSRDRQHLTNLPIVTDGSFLPGDIAAWRTQGGEGQGHSSVHIGGNVLVYAGGPPDGTPQARTLDFVNERLSGSHEPYVVRRYNGKP